MLYTCYNGPHPVSLIIHAGGLSELGLQASDLLLELVSLVFTLHSLLLYAQEQTMWKAVRYIKQQHGKLPATLK